MHDAFETIFPRKHCVEQILVLEVRLLHGMIGTAMDEIVPNQRVKPSPLPISVLEEVQCVVHGHHIPFVIDVRPPTEKQV